MPNAGLCLNALRGVRAALVIATLAMPGAAAAAAARWTIEPSETRIAFAVDAIGYPRTEGVFRRFVGRLAIDFARPELSNVAFRVQSASVDVGSRSFSDYLRSDAFLNAARFPTIEFVSTSVTKISADTVRVSGDLTLLGVTRPLTVDVTVQRAAPGGRSRLVFHAKADIDRLEFGMNSGFPLVSKDVALDVSTQANEP